MIQSIKDIKNIKGKRILVRTDFNVSIKDGKVVDGYRIEKALPTINYLKSHGAKVILISHIGRDEKETLEPVAKFLTKQLKLTFIKKITGSIPEEAVKNMKDGDVILLENLRSDKGEEGNSKMFALELSKLADIYVNDAFSASHRDHASIVILPKLLPSYAGLQMMQEVNHLGKVLNEHKHPFLFILGGAKFETKIPLMKKFMKIADDVFIGGALANQIFHELGYPVGTSLVEDKTYGLAKTIKDKKIMTPVDVVVFDGKKKSIKSPKEVGKKDNMLDIGPKTVAMLTDKIKKSKMILWNGPLGKSGSGYDDGTKALLMAIGKSKAISVIGGGDTIEVISRLKMEKNFTFVSTGGGAALEFLSKGTLPGIKALEKPKNLKSKA